VHRVDMHSIPLSVDDVLVVVGGKVQRLFGSNALQRTFFSPMVIISCCFLLDS